MIKGLFGNALAFALVAIEDNRETGIFRRNQRFFRRSFVQAHGGETQIREIIAGTINLKQGIERFPAAQWIMGDAQPKLLRLARQIPFRSQASKPNFMLGIFFARALGIVPERNRFRIGAFLARLLPGICLIGES